MALSASSSAENRTEQAPLTMEQLMRELRIQGGNFQFSFDKPVFARVKTEVGDSSKAGQKEALQFSTASANNSISLFFSASALFVGEYRQPNVVFTHKMMVKLSDCKETEGTRIVHYTDKFTGNHARYSPAVPAVPQIGKEYILHWYFKEGDPYSAKAVIEFSENRFPE
jgi:hypothetical protein